MLQRQDPFDGELSLEDVRGLSKQDQAAEPSTPQPAVQPKAAAPAPKPTPKPLAAIVTKNGQTLLGEPADAVVINPEVDPRMNEETIHSPKNGKHAFIVGGFSPFTTAHHELVKHAQKHFEHVHVFATDSKKRPFSGEDKVKYIKNAVGPNVHVSTTKTPLHAASEVYKRGAKDASFVGGSDRKEIVDRVNAYNGKAGGHGEYHFKHPVKLEVFGGERKEGASGLAGVSGTKARASKSPEELKKYIPKANHKYAAEMHHTIKSFVKEDVDLSEGTVSITSRMRRAVNMRKNAARMERAREIARRRLAKQAALSRRAMKKAKSILRTRLAGSQGTNYGNLSVSQKIAIDKMVDRRKGAIKRIAAKIAPRIKGDEMRRLQSVTTGKKFNSAKMVVASYQLFGDIIAEKEYRAINEKAESSGIPVSTLLAVFNRGKAAWNSKQPPGKTPSQYAFDRLNSYVSGGKAFKEDVDLREQTKPSLRDVLAKGMHTARNIETLDTKHIKPVQTAAAHAANIKDTNDDPEIEKKRKRANIIRRKTTEYVRKIVEERGVRDTTSPSLLESVSALVKKVK